MGHHQPSTAEAAAVDFHRQNLRKINFFHQR